MIKQALLFLLIFGFSQLVIAEVQILSPVESTLDNGASIQAGFISPNQTFELIFSDNSGFGFEWNRLNIPQESLPSSWKLVGTEITDTSLIAKIKVPKNAQPNFYVLNLDFSNTEQPSIKESVNVQVVVKQNLLEVSFARQSEESFSVVGGQVLYTAVISNASIAPHELKLISTLPSNWFTEKTLIVKPNSNLEEDLIVVPQVYGKTNFSFQADSASEGVVIKTFSSELNVRPTLKGKFASTFSGFPFFTFSLLPFQLLGSFISLVIPA